MTISIQICTKIGASFDPEKAQKWVDVSELHNLDYGLKPMPLKDLMHLMDVPMLLAG